jgi:L,D-transpeptidase ErfK/SrfK
MSWTAARGSDIIGGKTIITARRGDYLALIGSRVGVDSKIIARENGFETGMVFSGGEQLSVSNLRIVPKVLPKGIVINVPDRMLYFFDNGKVVLSFPVGLGQPQKEWQTPMGSFFIKYKKKDPTWLVPRSIQKEMEEKGEAVVTSIPPGKDNPLGRYALQTSLSNILIHEAVRPASVYRWRSHGCIRVNPEVMKDFFERVPTGTIGEVIYQPVTVAVQDGRVYLQVSKDIYKRVRSMDTEVTARISEQGLAERVDWTKVKLVARNRTGLAEDVTR